MPTGSRYNRDLLEKQESFNEPIVNKGSQCGFPDRNFHTWKRPREKHKKNNHLDIKMLKKNYSPERLEVHYKYTKRKF